MALELIEHLDGRLLEATAEGPLGREGFERLGHEVGRLVNRHVQIRLLVNLVAFTGWRDEVEWEALGSELGKLQQVSRLGIVAAVENPNWLATFKTPFTRAIVHVFAPVEKRGARSWLEEGIEPTITEPRPVVSMDSVALEADEATANPEASLPPEEDPVIAKESGPDRWSEWKEPLITAGFLGVLGLFGLVLEYITRTSAWWYWVVITPIFGFVAVRLESESAGGKDRPLWPLVRRQLLHWGGFLAALPLIAILVRNEVLSGKSQGLLTLLILTLTTYFAGISLNRVFLPASGALVVVTLLATVVEKYVFILFIVLALGLAAYMVYQKWLSRWFRRKPPEDPFASGPPSAAGNP